jgi:hypothetical protein
MLLGFVINRQATICRALLRRMEEVDIELKDWQGRSAMELAVTAEQENEASGQEHQELEDTGLFARVMSHAGQVHHKALSPLIRKRLHNIRMNPSLSEEELRRRLDKRPRKLKECLLQALLKQRREYAARIAQGQFSQ